MAKSFIYALTCMCFIIVIGGAVYEHMAVVPRWSASPPASLHIYQGEYGINPAIFWMVLHPVNLVLFIITLGLHWRTPAKKSILLPFIVYVAILVITQIYFVPELISITTTPFSETVDPLLTSRATLWEALSLARLGVLLVIAMVLLLGLTRQKQAPVATSKKLPRTSELMN